MTLSLSVSSQRTRLAVKHCDNRTTAIDSQCVVICTSQVAVLYYVCLSKEFNELLKISSKFSSLIQPVVVLFSSHFCSETKFIKCRNICLIEYISRIFSFNLYFVTMHHMLDKLFYVILKKSSVAYFNLL